MPYFQRLGCRALSCFLLRIGCSSWIAFSIYFSVRVISGETHDFAHSMLPANPPQEGGEAPNLPIGVMGPAAPSIDFLKTKRLLVFRSISRGRRKPRTYFLADIQAAGNGFPVFTPENSSGSRGAFEKPGAMEQLRSQSRRRIKGFDQRLREGKRAPFGDIG